MQSGTTPSARPLPEVDVVDGGELVELLEHGQGSGDLHRDLTDLVFLFLGVAGEVVERHALYRCTVVVLEVVTPCTENEAFHLTPPSVWDGRNASLSPSSPFLQLRSGSERFTNSLAVAALVLLGNELVKSSVGRSFKE